MNWYRALSTARGVLLAAFFCLTTYSTASAAFIQVSADMEIYSSGQAAPVGGGGLPTSFTFTPGSITGIRFTAVTGTVSCGPDCASDIPADGTSIPGYTGTNVACVLCGLSGVRFDGRQMFLVGVFLDDSSVPSGATPASFQSYTNASSDANVFAPGLNQVFFIGDGQGANGTQIFAVPAAAGRLYFGFAEGEPLFGAPASAVAPGGYADNSGLLGLTFDVLFDPIPRDVGQVPLPGTLALLALGLASAAVRRWSRPM